MLTVENILTALAQKAPLEQKMASDNVGLLVGRKDAPVTRVLAALDITDEVIAEAAAIGAELIVSHHPLFFELKTVTDEDWNGQRVLSLAENHIAAICLHTNLDAAEGGVNDALMAALGGRVTGTLEEESGIGRIGELSNPMTMTEFLPHVKKVLNTNGLRYHDAGKPVKHIAVCGGSGGSDLPLAAANQCDTFVTADIKYNQFLTAKHMGINLIDADHFCTENVVVPVLQAWLTETFGEITVEISRVHKQTAQFY